MFAYKKLPIKSFLASLCLHALLLAGFIFYRNLAPSEIRIGEKQIKIVNSYLYQDYESSTISTQKKNVHTTDAIKNADKMPKPSQEPLVKTQAPHNKSDRMPKKTLTQPPTKQTATSQTRPPSQSSSGEQAKGLIALLHAAIQNQQQYPPSALQMNRQGKATVSFKLYPDGSISDLELVKSSGVKSLDDAALAAVRSAAPFSEVSAYLKAAQDFNINVVFALVQGE